MAAMMWSLFGAAFSVPCVERPDLLPGLFLFSEASFLQFNGHELRNDGVAKAVRWPAASRSRTSSALPQR